MLRDSNAGRLATADTCSEVILGASGDMAPGRRNLVPDDAQVHGILIDKKSVRTPRRVFMISSKPIGLQDKNKNKPRQREWFGNSDTLDAVIRNRSIDSG